MSHTSYRTLLSWGRKAGLHTQELYQAINSRPPEGREVTSGQTDENGYKPGYDQQGHCVYRPQADSRS